MIVIKIHRCQIGQDFMTLYSRIFKCLVIAAWYILQCYNIWLLEVGRRTAARPGEVDAGPHILGAFLDRSLSELVILCNHFVGKWHTTSIWNSLKGNFFCFVLSSSSFIIFWNVSSYWFCLRWFSHTHYGHSSSMREREALNKA